MTTLCVLSGILITLLSQEGVVSGYSWTKWSSNTSLGSKVANVRHNNSTCAQSLSYDSP